MRGTLGLWLLLAGTLFSDRTEAFIRRRRSGPAPTAPVAGPTNIPTRAPSAALALMYLTTETPQFACDFFEAGTAACLQLGTTTTTGAQTCRLQIRRPCELSRHLIDDPGIQAPPLTQGAQLYVENGPTRTPVPNTFLSVFGGDVLVWSTPGTYSGAAIVVCANPINTHAPVSQSPTLRPTRFPTRIPTRIPSRSPTDSPTSAAPSSAAPTTDPTSGAPTIVPTGSPTSSPTGRPSAAPTTQPTATPTSTPTTAPSAFPTAQPTAAPTAPTAVPTGEPTTYPTAVPTAGPTAVPTVGPTASPTPPVAIASTASGAVGGGGTIIPIVVTIALLLVLIGFLFIRRKRKEAEEMVQGRSSTVHVNPTYAAENDPSTPGAPAAVVYASTASQQPPAEADHYAHVDKSGTVFLVPTEETYAAANQRTPVDVGYCQVEEPSLGTYLAVEEPSAGDYLAVESATGEYAEADAGERRAGNDPEVYAVPAAKRGYSTLQRKKDERYSTVEPPEPVITPAQQSYNRLSKRAGSGQAAGAHTGSPTGERYGTLERNQRGPTDDAAAPAVVSAQQPYNRLSKRSSAGQAGAYTDSPTGERYGTLERNQRGPTDDAAAPAVVSAQQPYNRLSKRSNAGQAGAGAAAYVSPTAVNPDGPLLGPNGEYARIDEDGVYAHIDKSGNTFLIPTEQAYSRLAKGDGGSAAAAGNPPTKYVLQSANETNYAGVDEDQYEAGPVRASTYVNPLGVHPGGNAPIAVVETGGVSYAIPLDTGSTA